MVDLAIVSSFISPIIVIACLCVGFVIKYAIPGETINRLIPVIMLILGVGLNIWALGALTLEVCVTGAVSGLASTGLYELFAQLLGLTIQENEEDEEEVEGKHIKYDEE